MLHVGALLFLPLLEYWQMQRSNTTQPRLQSTVPPANPPPVHPCVRGFLWPPGAHVRQQQTSLQPAARVLLLRNPSSQGPLPERKRLKRRRSDAKLPPGSMRRESVHVGAHRAEYKLVSRARVSTLNSHAPKGSHPRATVRDKAAQLHRLNEALLPTLYRLPARTSGHKI